MSYKRIGMFIAALTLICGSTFGQSATSMRINEVLVNNTDNFEDDYGTHQPWIELFNTSFASVDIRNCYLTNDRRVLDKSLSPMERAAMMYPIPKGDVLTSIPPRQHVLFWADNMPKRGNFHLNFTLDPNGSNWIALYDANATTLIDSITVPPLAANCSYGLVEDGVKDKGWAIMGIDNRFVTPSTNNKTLDTNEKIDGFKTKDPIGIGMAIMAMLVVFVGLILLYAVFKIVNNIGIAFAKKNAMRAHGITDKQEAKKRAIGTESGEVFAAISMALHEYQENVHDIEDTILTINRVKRSYSPWNSKIYALRQTPHK